MKLLLEEYIKLLIEDEYGGFDITSANADSPYGVSYGSGKDLYNVFVKPFTDVIDTTAGKTKELSQRAQTLLKVSFEAAATTLIPILEDDFDSIFENEKEQLNKIKSQYSDVYNATWSAFKDNDIVAAAFLYDPSLMITAKVAQEAPIQTVKLLNVLTGGKMDGFLKKVINKLRMGKKSGGSDAQGPGLPESLIREASFNVGKVLTQDKIRDVILSNPSVKNMMSSARDVINSDLKKIMKRVNVIKRANSVDELAKTLGVKLDDKIKKIKDQKQLLDLVKRSTIEFYTKNIDGRISSAIKNGVPENHPYVKAMKKLLSSISDAK